MKLLFSAMFAAATLLTRISAEGCSGGDSQSRLGDVGSIISRSMFDEIFKHRDDPACKGQMIFTYDAFIAAAKSYPAFGATGHDATRTKEIAAFLAQTSHETTGGWSTAPDGPFAWGYCFVVERNPMGDYCEPSSQWPCVPGKRYYGRAHSTLIVSTKSISFSDPIIALDTIAYFVTFSNYNYGPAGRAIGPHLLSNPELVATDPIVSFKTALWFWMTPQPPKPSCHDVITGLWTPTEADKAAGRVTGYGVITNIINGGVECGWGSDVPAIADRIGFYKRYCGLLNVTDDDNLDCYYQRPFGNGSTLAMVTQS